MEQRKAKTPPTSCSQEQSPPATPPCGKPESCSTTAADATPRVKKSQFRDTVKSELFHILEMVMYRYRKEICKECRRSNPDQRQHDCRNDMPDIFFRNNYKALMKRLWLADFVAVIDQSLIEKGILRG
ncbi:hypothetical protein CesoFtcFv8_002097 [Champsocephalus esox]|uniref:Uncharacterized protein n=1 Tax=Champsocephalus esox TaxID=159716 RepID=A0AAN8HDM2_9TELE|nr:hypothetical protein CesoFtcFv8_002097 [Champsocephalus esox]